MKTDVNGCSTCPNGTEQYETFRGTRGRQLYQYDFRYEDGELFSCVKPSLEECRAARDRHSWIKEMNAVLAHIEDELASCIHLAKSTAGKWVNIASNGLVMINFSGKGEGINDTGYDTTASRAMLFDSEDESYRSGNTYLVAMVGGKKVPVYVNPYPADKFFHEQAVIMQDTANALREAIRTR